MQFSNVLITAISAAAVLAAPVDKRALVTDWVVDVVTLTTTVYPDSATPTTAPAPLAALQSGGWGGSHGGHKHHSHRPHSSSSNVPSPTTQTSVVVTPTPTPSSSSTSASDPTTETSDITTPTPEPSTTAAASTTDQPTTSTPSETTTSDPADTGRPNAGACSSWSTPTDFSTPFLSCGVSLKTTMNAWRQAYNLPTLLWDPQMAQNSFNTVSANQGGVVMNHHLESPSNAEVITPGFWETGTLETKGDSPFEVAMVDWLCEVPTDPQLQSSGFTGIDQCDIAHNVANISGSANKDEPTGHHDILTGDYDTFGCAWMPDANGDGGWQQFSGQWVCNFRKCQNSGCEGIEGLV